MSDVSDEMLMEYADGVLDAQKIARLEKQLAGDATLALRLQAFERTRTGELARVFDPVLHAPVPQRLMRAASATPASLPPRAQSARQSGGIAAAFLDRLIEGFCGMLPVGTSPMAAAFALAGAVVIAGYGTRMMALQVPEPDPFRITLETAQSGTSIRFTDRDGQRFITPALSFQDRDGRFCRKYDVDRADRTRLSGVACRSADGNWKIEFETETGRAPTSREYVTVGATGLDDRIMEMIEGNSFDRKTENEFLKKGWK